MVPFNRVWTVSLSILALVVSTAALLLTGCCGSDQWKQQVFREAGLRFSVPSNWTVTVQRPGQNAVNPDKDDVDEVNSGDADGAVLSALPVLEDAALILIATQQRVAVDIFARRVADFIPLNGVQFISPLQPYSLNGLTGFAGEGSGQLPSDGTPVYFRCMVLDIDGKPVIVTLYSEELQRTRYEQIFDTILARLHPLRETSRLDAHQDDVPVGPLHQTLGRPPRHSVAAWRRHDGRGALGPPPGRLRPDVTRHHASAQGPL